MKTLKYLLATMLLLGVCNLTHSQKLSLGIFPEPQEVTISSQTYTPPHGYTLRGINNPDADAVKLLKEALPFAKSGKSLPLEIKKLKDKTPEMQRSGAYTLTITKKGITIGIVDDNSLFYAAQTLKQLAKYDEGKKILPLLLDQRLSGRIIPGYRGRILRTALEPRRPYRANPLLRKDQAEHLYLWSER